MEKPQGKWVDANQFETLNKEVGALSLLKKTSEALEEGWTFQGKKKHKVKIATTRPTIGHPSQPNAPPAKVMGEKRGQKQLVLHRAFFESLRILLLEIAEQCKARI